MLYLIGLGLNKKGISYEALSYIKRCKKVYLENYTVSFPYPLKNLERVIGRKIKPIDRDFVENMYFLSEAKKVNIAILVYGDPLFATTHISMIQEAKKLKVGVKIFHAASIFDFLGETGLQLYKFGKITSIPNWKKNYEPTSFLNTIKENQQIGAHSLILIDIDLTFHDVLNKLEQFFKNSEIQYDKIIICSKMGSKEQKIVYGDFEKIKKLKNIKNPFCFVIPGKLHFFEKEFLENFK
ncbi:MAG: diphthine synthase [Candidatus Pacearchaeota archaeon]